MLSSSRFPLSQTPINPKLSFLFTNSSSSSLSNNSKKSRLQTYKQHYLNIQTRKLTLPSVPQPSIISLFSVLKQIKLLLSKKQQLKKSNKLKKQEYQKINKVINKYKQIYQNKEQALKEKVLLSKILSTKLQTEFVKTKEMFKDIEFTKIINTAQKKLALYQLAEIFYNNNARMIFQLQKQPKMDQTTKMAINLGYLSMIIEQVASILSIQTFIKFKFKGPKSTITVTDPKTIGQLNSLTLSSNTSTNSSSKQSQYIIPNLTFILHPRDSRWNQAVGYLCEQLRQIMKYNLNMNIMKMTEKGKKNNFYQMCEELSKCLMGLPGGG